MALVSMSFVRPAGGDHDASESQASRPPYLENDGMMSVGAGDAERPGDPQSDAACCASCRHRPGWVRSIRPPGACTPAPVGTGRVQSIWTSSCSHAASSGRTSCAGAGADLTSAQAPLTGVPAAVAAVPAAGPPCESLFATRKGCRRVLHGHRHGQGRPWAILSPAETATPASYGASC